MAQMLCEVEFQVADARTGRSVSSTLCPRAAVGVLASCGIN